MPVLRSACALLVVSLGCSLAARAQADKSFPEDEEVALLLTQTDRAIQRYKPLLDEQDAQIGKSVADDVANDRKLIGSFEATLKTLNAKHQLFNGSMGFSFFAALADVDRSALRCGLSASSQSSGYEIAGDREKADALLHLSQKCIDVSMLLYTVSENASSLYKRFIFAEDQWAAHSTQEARQCEDDLEKNKAKKFEPVF